MKSIVESVKTVDRPIKVLQFGEGNFLRAFVDWIVDNLNEKAGFNGNVMMVQPLERGMGEMINAQKGLYTTCLTGVQDGKPVKEFRAITSVAGCINPYSDYDAFIAQAENPDLRFVISNTTEAGIAYSEGDRLEDRPQTSYPGKLCAFLYRRYQAFKGDMSKGIIMIPCELIDKNGDNLKRIVERYASEWKLEEGFTKWLEEACDFCNSLVDRIVPGYPRAEADAICEQLGYKDNLIDMAELFLLWVIECHKKSHEDELPTGKAGLNVVWTDDMTFYRTRKVRILNGTHTMMALASYLCGINTVEDSVKSPVVGKFMREGLFNEIIPSMDGDLDELRNYANDVLDRFANPYIEHLLLSISLNSVSKFKTRDLPSLLGYVKKKGQLPKHLALSIAALLAFYRGTEFEGDALVGERAGEKYLIKDTKEYLETFAELYKADYKCNGCRAKAVVEAILPRTDWWGLDLTTVPGLKDAVQGYLQTILDEGMEAAIRSLD